MLSYHFMPHVRLHCFSDGSGIVIYSNHSGETVMLQSERAAANDDINTGAGALHSWSALTQFTAMQLQQDFSFESTETQRVLEYLLDCELIGCVT